MKQEEFLKLIREGKELPVKETQEFLDSLAQEALKIIDQLNNQYHSPEKVRDIFSELIGKPVDSSFKMFPPFYTECGKNTFIGKNVFINFQCHFQDQGGIFIGDNVFIGSQNVFATINHGTKPDERGHHLFSSIHIKDNVWIGSHVTILPGVTIGENSIIAAGAVVSKDIPANSIAAGVPAKVIKQI